MASERNEAPKSPMGWGVRKGASLPTGVGSGEVAMSPPQKFFFDF